MTASTNPLPLWLDTDIGDDVDDVLALSLILGTPQLALRGISTVYIDTPRRAHLARKILATWNRFDIPVVIGSSKPLLQPIRPQECHQFSVLDDADREDADREDADREDADREDADREDADREDADRKPDAAIPMRAVQALLEAVESHALQSGGEKLTVLAIGALTNIALALALRPDLVDRIRLSMMGGQGIEGKQAEWNILCDPEAAAMVFASGVEIWQVGYDITTQVQLDESHLEHIAKHESDQIRLLWQLIQLWQGENRHLPYLHDPLAALTLFSDCVRFEPRSASVDLCGDRRAMIAYAEPCPDRTPVQVAVEVDASRAIETFMERLLG